MCVIFAVPAEKGVFPTEDEILSGELMNDDGGGVAWATGGTVFWKKGLTGAQVLGMIKEGELKPPCLIHFRISTEGGVCHELTHPFPCTPDAPLILEGSSTTYPLLMHNGTVGRWKDEMKEAVIAGRGTIKVPKGKWSDSRALAFFVGLYGDGYLQFLSGLTGDRVALLWPNGSIQYTGKWEEKEGFWASNESYIYGRKGKAWEGFQKGGVECGRNVTPLPTVVNPTPTTTPHPQSPVTSIVKSEGTKGGSEVEVVSAKALVRSSEEIQDLEDRLQLAWTKRELQELLKETKGRTLVTEVRVMVN